ncbi:hypothetical protein HK101_005456 [Irineochytrium annulatum]|nr:hypothetical protein HK101_005456 [Irineochytrium annulatum]
MSSFEQVFAIGGQDSGTLELVQIPRRPVGDHDVHIKVAAVYVLELAVLTSFFAKIAFTGMCHSDLHHVKGEWGPAKRPAVPGHEIIGHVDRVGAGVTKFKVGDTVGVGCFVDSCRTCDECTHEEKLIQYCSGKREGGFPGLVGTYGAPVVDGTGHTFGGYSQAIVVDENYVLSIPSGLDLAAAAPLLCAGITTWSPLVHYGVKAGHKVAVLGLGGLGHMAVKFAAAMGAHVTVLSRSAGKEAEALKLGAENVLIYTNEDAFKSANRSFDFIVDTVSAKHDINAMAGLLRTDGTLIIVGGVPEPLQLSTFSLIGRRIKIGGSLVGSIKETQEMLDFCGEKGIVSDIELVKAGYANKAWDRMLKSDVKFRFVLDIQGSLSKETVVEA